MIITLQSLYGVITHHTKTMVYNSIYSSHAFSFHLFCFLRDNVASGLNYTTFFSDFYAAYAERLMQNSQRIL